MIRDKIEGIFVLLTIYPANDNLFAEDNMMRFSECAMESGTHLSDQLMLAVMVDSACSFLEFPCKDVVQYFRDYGYNGPDPIAFKPGIADRLILMRLMRKYLDYVPENYKIFHNAGIYGYRVLFEWYYYDYQNRNYRE